MYEINDIWNILSPLAVKKTLAKKSWLIHEGEVCKHAFFIEQGCLRSWFNDDGKDITFQFFFEGHFASSFESLRMNKPCLFNIETITPATVHIIQRGDLLRALDESPALKEAATELLCHRFYHYQKLFLSRIKNNPQRRYEELVKESPELFERIPHHYIASYLGITPVSLSRIRNKEKP